MEAGFRGLTDILQDESSRGGYGGNWGPERWTPSPGSQPGGWRPEQRERNREAGRVPLCPMEWQAHPLSGLRVAEALEGWPRLLPRPYVPMMKTPGQGAGLLHKAPARGSRCTDLSVVSCAWARTLPVVCGPQKVVARRALPPEADCPGIGSPGTSKAPPAPKAPSCLKSGQLHCWLYFPQHL